MRWSLSSASHESLMVYLAARDPEATKQPLHSQHAGAWADHKEGSVPDRRLVEELLQLFWTESAHLNGNGHEAA